MYIKLGQEDYDAIAEIIADMDDECNGVVEYCDLVEICFSKKVKAERDDDYISGTVTWEVQSVEFRLEKSSVEMLRFGITTISWKRQ